MNNFSMTKVLVHKVYWKQTDIALQLLESNTRAKSIARICSRIFLAVQIFLLICLRYFTVLELANRLVVVISRYPFHEWRKIRENQEFIIAKIYTNKVFWSRQCFLSGTDKKLKLRDKEGVSKRQNWLKMD